MCQSYQRITEICLFSNPNAIAGDFYHTCALLDNASVKCWGLNTFGQLGIDNSTNEPSLISGGEVAVLPVVNLGTGRTATAIAGGIYHSCALLDNASVKCWGYNGYGQLGIRSNDMGDNTGEMAVLPSIDFSVMIQEDPPEEEEEE